MSRKFGRKKTVDTIPAWLSLKIRDAGASAYAWGESELLARLDPDQKLQRISDITTRASIAAASVLLVTVGFSINTASGLVTLIIATAALLRSGARYWSSLSLGSVLVALWPLRSESLGMLTLVLFGVLGVTAYLHARGSRFAVAVAGFGALGVTAGGMPELLPVVLLVVVAGALAFAGVIGPKLGNDVPFMRAGPPPSTIPWLIRLLKRDAIKDVPAEIRRKSVGAEGERATAVRLLGLQGHSTLGVRGRAKALAVHDIVSLDEGKTRANLDHLVLTTAGLFVLDTKVFASGSTVMVSGEQRDVLVTSPGGQSKSIMPLIRALVQECVATREALSYRTTGFLVIHGARVPRGISVRFEQDDVTVEVVDQKDLIGRLDAPRRGGMSKGEFRSLARAIRNIPSASGGRSTPVRPLRLVFANRPHVPAPAAPALVFSNVAPEVAPAAPSVQRPDGLLANWDAMMSSPPAPADLVDEEMRVLTRGQRFVAFSISEDLSSVPMFAMTGPCQAGGGPIYVWATDEPNWNAFLQTSKPVAITRVPLGRIIIESPVNP